MYAIKEYACTVVDVIARRTSLAFLNVQAAEEAIPCIVDIMGKELGWSKEERKVNICVSSTTDLIFVKLATNFRCKAFFRNYGTTSST